MELLLFIAIFLIGLFLLEKGADLFTDKVGELAERTRASETVVGLLTAGIEWEELVVVVIAAASGNIGIAVGNVIGSNIANITGSFSLGLLVKPISIRRDDRIYVMAMLGLTLLAAVFLFQGEVGRGSGLILLAIFALYLAVLIVTLVKGTLRVQFDREVESEGDQSDSVLKLSIFAFVGLALIVAGAEAVIQSSLYFARLLGLSEFVVGLTLVSVGTTLPDKVISIAAALKGRSGIVAASAIGSNIFNLFFVLGLAAVIQPLYVDQATLAFDVPVLIGVSTLMAVMFLRQQLHRLEGAILLSLYVAYLVYNFAFK
ncbi:MAG: sodium:calcium antiporter [Dehalococcoidia bacterium]|nr:sodium:calcium antiporter [Dehalococcoidia bacterium]